MKLCGFIKVGVMAMIMLNTADARMIAEKQVIRSVPDDRDPGNINTPPPHPTSPPSTAEPDRDRDCGEILDRSPVRPGSGVYEIRPLGQAESFKVYCDFNADGGGWTVIQRRVDGSVDFDLGWDDYEAGFGDLKTEFWLGNEKVHSLTEQKRYQLRIELTNWYGLQYYAKYSYFAIGGADQHYILSAGTYSGNSNDALTYHNAMLFSTKDADNDHNSNYNYAASYGGWWYKSCCTSRLNAPYLYG